MIDPVDAAWQACAARRPEVSVTRDGFAAYLEARRPAALPQRDQLATWCLDDLYLACACVSGDPAAIAAFERDVLSLLDAALASYGREIADETRQRLRASLLVDQGGNGPLLASYTGRGALRRWIRVVASREAGKLARGDDGHAAIDDEAMFNALSPPDDPALSAVKRDAAAAFRAALVDALRELPRRDRTLLRMHILDGLTIDELAPLHRVHRATCARWITAAKQSVLDRTRRRLMHELRLDAEDVDSLIRVARSRIELPSGALDTET
jgi:RNA polymerase sigma-70 factor (ECF subfamily)